MEPCLAGPRIDRRQAQRAGGEANVARGQCGGTPSRSARLAARSVGRNGRKICDEAFHRRRATSSAPRVRASRRRGRRFARGRVRRSSAVPASATAHPLRASACARHWARRIRLAGAAGRRPYRRVRPQAASGASGRVRRRRSRPPRRRASGSATLPRTPTARRYAWAHRPAASAPGSRPRAASPAWVKFGRRAIHTTGPPLAASLAKRASNAAANPPAAPSCAGPSTSTPAISCSAPRGMPPQGRCASIALMPKPTLPSPEPGRAAKLAKRALSSWTVGRGRAARRRRHIHEMFPQERITKRAEHFLAMGRDRRHCRGGRRESPDDRGKTGRGLQVHLPLLSRSSLFIRIRVLF